MPETSKPTFPKAFSPAQVRRKPVLAVIALSFCIPVTLIVSKKVEGGKKSWN